jgi:serine protease inhibitor
MGKFKIFSRNPNKNFAAGAREKYFSHLAAAVRTEKPQAGELTAKDAAAAASFGVKLLQQSEKDGTRLYSPVSILYALGMTLNGANGETKTQMEKTLGLTADELNRAMLAYRSSLPADGAAKIANSIWIRDTENLKVSGDFLKTDSAYYNAEIYRAAFDSSTLDAINAWVSEHTDKMIPTILQELPESAMLCLVNAVAFNAKWAEPYEETDVSDADFTKADGTKETVKMMYSAENVYLDDGQATGFLKRYEGGDYAFAALMPNEGVSMDDYVASLTGESLMNTLENAQSCGVDAGLPKFTRDYSAELSQTLAALGMPDAFDPAKADFSNMGESAEGTLAISQVIHKTHIELDEQGTKAAAATAVMATTTCVALEAETKRVILNRPFVYMILDTRTNLPVFLGLMADPANS